MGTTGSLTRWFKDEFARDLDDTTAYASLFEAAADVRAGSEGLLVLPYFSGERTPINDTQASGVIAGLNLSHTRAQMFRAVLEGVGFGVRHNLETFGDIGADVRRIVAVGGGAQTRTWLQIVSDICGVTQVLPQVTVGAAYGDAFLAGCAAGLLQPQDLQDWVRVESEITPQPQNRAIYDALYAQYLRLYRESRDVVHRLKAITTGRY
jgi:xylulokinase